MKEIPGLLYTSPYTFTAKQRVALTLAPPVVATGLKALVATCRKEVRDGHYWDEVLKTHGRGILAFWHETMGFAVCHHAGTSYHTLTSYSYDGELAARVLRHFGCFAVRGSSSSGGATALRCLEEVLNHVPGVGITLDGPRGPRRVAKPGVAILSARTGVPITPRACAVCPAWRLHSWDRFPIPKPFSRLITMFGPAIPPPPDTSEQAVESTRLRVETELNRLHAILEAELGTPADLGL